MTKLDWFIFWFVALMALTFIVGFAWLIHNEIDRTNRYNECGNRTGDWVTCYDKVFR